MEHLAAFMLVLACNGMPDSCREIAAPGVGYEVMEDCLADQAPVLASLSGEGEEVMAQCVALDPLSEGDLEIVWQVTANREIIVEVRSPDQATTVSVADLSPAGKQSRLQ